MEPKAAKASGLKVPSPVRSDVEATDDQLEVKVCDWTNCVNEKDHLEIVELAKVNLDLLRAATVGEDSDDDSQYETADESESDLEL